MPKRPSNRRAKATVGIETVPTLAYANNLMRIAFSSHTDSAEKYSETLQQFTSNYITTNSYNPEITSRMHDHDVFRAGLPYKIIDRHVRGIPKHYSNPEQYRDTQRESVSGMHRAIAGLFALGIGGGLRIGECLALRISHFLKYETIANAYSANSLYEHINREWDGRINVESQASQQARGKNIVSLPKMRKTRIATMPTFLVGNGFVSCPLPANAQDALTLSEALQVWDTYGTAPMRAITVSLLTDTVARAMNETSKSEWDDYRAAQAYNALLFPTRTPARTGKNGEPSTIAEEGYQGLITPCPITHGGYMSQTNIGKWTSPIYNLVSEYMDEGNRLGKRNDTNSKTSIYTHHSLRHFAISARLYGGQDVTDVAQEFGHATPAFTYEKYAWAIRTEKQNFRF